MVVMLGGQIKGRLLLSEGEKASLAEIAQRLGRKALEELAAVAKPDALLAWYRKLIANKFDGSKFRQRFGRPRIDEEAERLVVQMAKENPSWPASKSIPRDPKPQPISSFLAVFHRVEKPLTACLRLRLFCWSTLFDQKALRLPSRGTCPNLSN